LPSFTSNRMIFCPNFRYPQPCKGIHCYCHQLCNSESVSKMTPNVPLIMSP
jgi:hypothetical protein